MATENFKSNLITGLVAGLAATLLAPVLRPFLANASRSLTKATIKGSIHLYEKGHESFAELGETVDDLMAEVRSEMETGAQGGAVVASGTQAATAQGKTAPPSPQLRPGSDTSQGSATSAAVQPGQAGKAPQSPPAPPAPEASPGNQRSENAQGRPSTQGE